jgi:hypothetical protein
MFMTLVFKLVGLIAALDLEGIVMSANLYCIVLSVKKDMLQYSLERPVF